MLYRCRACNHEEDRGCLPAATCGVYLMVLLGVTVAVGLVAVQYLRAWAREVQAARLAAGGAPPGEVPWWVAAGAGAISLAVTLGFFAGGVLALNFALQLVEYAAFARRRCPACGARQWSWGFTRGFGA